MCGIEFAIFRGIRYFAEKRTRKMKTQQATYGKVSMRFSVFQISLWEPVKKCRF